MPGKKSFKKPEKKKAGEHLRDKSIKERIDREAARYKDAIDSEIWACICFLNEDELNQFMELTGATSRMVRADSLNMPEFPHKKGFAPVPTGEKIPSPWENFEPTGNIEEDSRRELEILLEAMENVEPPKKLTVKNITDSDIWICVVADSQREKDIWLQDNGLYLYGDKYIDGSTWLKKLPKH